MLALKIFNEGGFIQSDILRHSDVREMKDLKVLDTTVLLCYNFFKENAKSREARASSSFVID